jgi:hypothetical protein
VRAASRPEARATVPRMSRPAPTISAPRRTSPLRVLAGIACVAVTIAAVAVTVLCIRLMSTTADVDRVVADASGSVHRLDAGTADLGPAIGELRRAARSLRQIDPAAGP